MSRPNPSTLVPRPSAAEIRHRLAGELSLRSRVAYTLLLLADLAVGGAVASLLLTEPGLAPRTRLAFAAMVGIAAAWAAVFVWILTRRKVLLARHRLVTARLAVAVTALYTLGALALALAPQQRGTGLAAAVFGTVLLAVAVVLWRRAAGRHRRLLARARKLERELGCRLLLVLLLGSGLVWPGLPGAASAAAVEGFGAAPLELRPGTRPAALLALGRRHLVYELHVTNLADEPRRLVELAVTDGAGTPLGGWAGEALARRVRRPGARPDGEPDLLAPGARAVVFLWLALAPGEDVPARLRHRLTTSDAAGGSRDHVSGAAVEVAAGPAPAGRAPVGPGRWVALRAPSATSGHRLSLVALDGTLAVPQRFAVDWVRLGDDGRFFRGDGSTNDDWYGWGRPVSAARPGRVARVIRGLPDHPPGGEEARPFTSRKTAAGNAVVIDEGDGRHAVYAHLRRGSVAVEEGAVVAAGARLGAIGNSGHSRAPHLHVHVDTLPGPLAGEGLPFALTRFRLLGKLDAPGAMLEGAAWRPDPRRPARTVVGETPLENMVVEIAPAGVR